MSGISLQLKLVKDTGRYLVTDYEGRQFWFDKQQIIDWRVDNGQAQIDVEETAWQRRLRNIQVHPAEPAIALKARKCLCCGAKFEAEKNIYVCGPCKRTEAWKAGGTVFVN